MHLPYAYSRMDISLWTIVKNEQDWIETAVESVRSIAGEVIIPYTVPAAATVAQIQRAIFCVSAAQRTTFIESFQLPAGKAIATRNLLPADMLHEPAAAARERVSRIHTWSAIAARRNGNSNAVTRVLTEMDKTLFLRSEVENSRGRLNTWM